MQQLGKYMFVREPMNSKTGKTKIWIIVDRNNSPLGDVRWFGRWRCYAFFPEPDTVFNASCMNELVSFCDGATEKQRRKA